MLIGSEVAMDLVELETCRIYLAANGLDPKSINLGTQLISHEYDTLIEDDKETKGKKM